MQSALESLAALFNGLNFTHGQDDSFNCALSFFLNQLFLCRRGVGNLVGVSRLLPGSARWPAYASLQLPVGVTPLA